MPSGRLSPSRTGTRCARQRPNGGTGAETAAQRPSRRQPLHELLRLDLPVLGADLRTVHLTRVGTGYPRRRPGLAVHPSVSMPLTDAGRIPPQLAIVQTGMVCGPMAALIAADAALGRRLVTSAQLSAAVEAMRGGPGSALIGPFLALADGRSQSPGETRLRHAFHLMEVLVTPQAKISAGGRTAYVDFLLEEYPVVVEFDGLVKYGAQGLRPGRDELVAEKQREDWLRELGYEVVRVTWKDLDDLAALARRIHAAIRRAGAACDSRPGAPIAPNSAPRARNAGYGLAGNPATSCEGGGTAAARAGRQGPSRPTRRRRSRREARRAPAPSPEPIPPVAASCGRGEGAPS